VKILLFRRLIACWAFVWMHTLVFRSTAEAQDPVPVPTDTLVLEQLEELAKGDPGEGPELTQEEWTRASDDTVLVEQRGFDQGAIDRHLSDDDLNYDRTEHEERLSWSHWLRAWLDRMLDRTFGSKSGDWLIRHLEWIIIPASIIFLIWYFRKRIFANAFAASPARHRQVTVMEENIEEMDLDKLLRGAERDEKWAFALRYHYLKVLRRLVDEGKIEWQPRYTDHDYLSQLSDPQLRATFSELSFVFKWVWYGDAPLDQAGYERLKRPFVMFHQRHSQAA
jgi:hypothetical protein